MSQGEVEVANKVEDDSAHDTNSTEILSAAGDASNLVVHHDETGTAINKTACQNSCKNETEEDSFYFSNTKYANLECLRQLNEEFIKARNWDQFHSPRNVLLALVGEVGELAEIFQWKGEVSEGLPELSQAEKDHVGQEVSDILLYLTDFAARCRIDLPKAVASKMAANGVKYPVDKAYGKANKYTDYT